MSTMNYAEYRVAWDNATKCTPNIPLNIDIELSALCNLKCPFCFLQNKNYIGQYGFMPVELACKIIDEANSIGVPALKFNWRGEPAIHPAFSSIMEYAKSKKFIDLLVNTNGNFTENAIDGMMCATKVMISLDSMEPLTYRKMRCGGNLMRVLNNISRLIEAGHKNIWVRRVVTDDNIYEKFTDRVLAAFRGDVRVSQHAIFERSESVATPTKRIYCGYPSQRLVISHKGDVFPCCVDYFETMKLGNIKTNSIMDIWKSPELKHIRQGLKTGEQYPGQCADCRSWMGYADKRRELVADKEIK